MAPEEYLELDRQSEFRNEYAFGEMVAMAGGSPTHSRIAANLVLAVGRRLEGTRCEFFESSLRVCVDDRSFYAYPDFTVVCGDLKFIDSRRDTITNPKLVAEVISPSTRDYDLGSKARMYARVASLDEILLIEQDRVQVERWQRQPNQQWTVSNTSGIDAVLNLSVIGCEVPLSEIYRNVTFETTVGTDAPAAS